MTRRLTAWRSRRGQSGSALIEFALIAPILMSLILAMYDLGPALLVKFKVASATQAVADLTTQTPTVQMSDIVNLFAAGGDVLAPFSSSSLVLRITNVASNGLGGTLAGAFVYWSCGQGALPPLTASTFVQSTPTGTPLTDLLILSLQPLGPYLISGINTSYIMVESQYTFTPPAGFVFQSAQTLTNTALRHAAPVDLRRLVNRNSRLHPNSANHEHRQQIDLAKRDHLQHWLDLSQSGSI